VDADTITASLEQIPYTLEMGIVIERAASGEVEMTLPDATANQTMVGIVHAGALYTFGETVAGIAAGSDLLDKAFPLARKAEIRYSRPASGAIRGRAKVAAVDSERVLAELSRDGRSELGVAVILSDGDGKIVAEMNVDYAFRAFKSREK
jgi:acyl-coenzyme A thioesterase PaaI-like protein